MGFWQHHGWLFLLAMTCFPRISMVAAGTINMFNPIGWIGWLFAPHITVAFIATTLYWQTDPVLCVVAWFIALGGTSTEAKATTKVLRR